MSETAAAFDELTKEYFSVWFRYHPDVAIQAGVGGFERLLPAQSDDELSALGSWLETLVLALEELDFAALDEDRQIDLRLMFGAARVEHQELLERDWRHRDPLRYLPVCEIYHLTLKQPEDIREILAALLRAVPEYLRLAISQLRSMAELVAPEMVSAAVDETERGRCYLRELVRSSWLRHHCHGWSEIAALIDGAGDAFAAYGDALRGEIARRAHGHLACGEDHLRFLFKHRHFMDFDPGRTRILLAEALARSDEDLARLCAELGIAPEQVWQHLQRDTVAGTERLEVCRNESDRLASFVTQAGLLSLPDVALRISERPACPRPQRFGADYVADREQGTGTFFLGAAADSAPGEPLAILRGRCRDKGWGGAHLLAFAGGDDGWRLPRRLSGSGDSLACAWGLYLGQRLTELGFHGPEDRLHAALRRRVLVQRALLDLDLHLGTASAGEVLASLEAVPDMGMAELVRFVRQPGDAVAGVLGWLALEQARELIQRSEAEGFSERAFHDRLLSHGAIPLPLTLHAELGDGPWRQIAERLAL